MTRVAWFRLVLGLVLGLIFGLYYAWFVSPRKIRQSTPQDLSLAFQNEFRTLVASAYSSTGDLSQALSRLELIEDPQPALSLENLAQSHLSSGRAEEEVRAVAQLASILVQGVDPDALSRTVTPEVIPIIPGPSPSPPGTTQRPTATHTPMPAYRLQSLQKVCDRNMLSPQIQVLVLNADGEGVPGVEVLIIWDEGEDHFYTGMKPELGLGYGDFTMEVDITYTLHLASAFQSVTPLRSEECAIAEGGVYPGSILLRFEEP